MKNSNIFITIKKELRATVRDKKSLLMMFLVPLFIPLFVFLFSYMYDVMLSDEDKDACRLGINYELSDVEKKFTDALNLEITNYKTEELQLAYEKGKIDAYLILEDGNYKLYYNNMDTTSNYSGIYARAYLDSYNNYLGQLYLIEEGINPESVFNIITYSEEQLVGNSDLVNQIILMAFVFAVMAITLTAIYSATDSTAGEKERGTLETLLTFPIKNSHLIIGKYLAGVIACIITAIIGIILLLVSLGIARGMFDIYDEVVFNFNAITILLAFIILVGHALFICGASIAIASFSKTYKEAQSALTPLSLASIIPMFINILEIEMTPILSAIPIINHTLLLNDIFNGNVNYLNIAIMFISTIICVILVIKFIVKQYRSEKILFSI
jgi:ABC-type Na+ efflux pump, permease component